MDVRCSSNTNNITTNSNNQLNSNGDLSILQINNNNKESNTNNK